MSRKKLPVIVVSGFLGSGKTSLLSRVLQSPSMAHTSVIVNEFGKIGLDHHLLSQVEERTILLGGGCLCCSTREDLVEAFLKILNERQQGTGERIDRIVIETTGLADPSPIFFTLLRHPVLQHHFEVERIVVTVDAVNGLFHLERHEESIKQAAVADRLIITKTDIAEPEQVERLAERLRLLNPSAVITVSEPDNSDAAEWFVGPMPAAGHEGQREPVGLACLDKSENGGIQPHSLEGNDTRSISVEFREPLEWHAFGLWLSMLLHAHGTNCLRVKGLLDLGGEGPVSLNGVQHIIHPPEHLSRWPNEENVSRIVFITRGIEPKRILDSLLAFQSMLGAVPKLSEMQYAL